MQSLINKEKIRMTVQDDEASGVNVAGTDAKIDTPLTHLRSPDVLKTSHRDLLKMRNKVGAETPLGHHLSNLDQQLRNWERETDPTAKAHLERFIARSVEAIDRLTRTA
jgi:hypothetical protein